MEKKNQTSLDQTLRPNNWDEYIGQKNIKDNLWILLEAAKIRNEPPEHILFHGQPGLGKTTLSYLIARELGRPVKTTSGPAIERVGDLASIITNLEAGEILFIDEIHRLNKNIEEVLYPAMERGVLDIILGKGPSARTIQLELQPFTLIGATTKMAMLSSPLRSRFSGGVFKLEQYSPDELAQIVMQSAKKLSININNESANMLAGRSRANPRRVNQFLKRCRDYAEINQVGKIDEGVVEQTLQMIGVDEQGLDKNDREYLDLLKNNFSGGPVGLKTIAAALQEDESVVEDIIEPYLIFLGLVEKTSRGRILK